jgi:DNA repair photolyase
MAKKTATVQRRILNPDSAFREKLLCDGPTFSAGDTCAYNCAFCYAFPLMANAKGNPEIVKAQGVDSIRDVQIRRSNSVKTLRSQLLTPKGKRKYENPLDTRVIYGSPLVDVAANIELTKETAELCREILLLTNWQIRLLSKSNLLPKLATYLEEDPALAGIDLRARMIFGVSTGTFNDGIAKAFEHGTALVSKRIQSLRELQERQFRTFGMICPSLPRPGGDYTSLSEDLCHLIRMDCCEHVWAEVINVRGDSMTATANGLREGGYHEIAKLLEKVSSSTEAWEEYNRETFLGHTKVIPPKKLRYLTYVTPATKDWWKEREHLGAVLLGKSNNF